ncbi:MAG: hypothetical protein QW587_03740 [Candidatus Bathyarchaeia archaeon]
MLVAPSTVKAQGPPFEFYGIVPPTTYTYGVDPPYPQLAWPNGTLYTPVWQNGTAYLDIVGINDTTSVKVYDISGGGLRLLDEAVVNRLQLHTVKVRSGTAFKVVADKLVSVALSGGQTYLNGGHLFYPSTDGGFAGTEFIFMALPSSETPGMPMKAGDRHAVYAVDDAKVSLYDAAGKLLKEYELQANKSAKLDLSYRSVFRIQSTGRIMVGTWDWSGYTALPSAFGGFRGTRFYATPDASVEGTVALVVTAQEQPVTVAVYDLDSGSKMVEKSLAAYELWNINKGVRDLAAKRILVEATGQVMVFAAQAGATGLLTDIGDDITFFGLKPGVTSTFYVVSKGYVFAPEADTEVRVGAVRLVAKKGSYVEIPSGLIRVTTNATAIVELLALADMGYWGQGLYDWATYLVSTRAVTVSYPPAKGGLRLPLTEIAGVAAIAVVVAAVAALRRPKGKTA